VPLIVVQPGDIALVVANDGRPIPSQRILGREVDCDQFQDAAAFLAAGGERGRQLAILTAGSYRINPALFKVVTQKNAREFGNDPTELTVTQIPSEQVGIMTVNDGQPIHEGDL